MYFTYILLQWLPFYLLTLDCTCFYCFCCIYLHYKCFCHLIWMLKFKSFISSYKEQFYLKQYQCRGFPDAWIHICLHMWRMSFMIIKYMTNTCCTVSDTCRIVCDIGYIHVVLHVIYVFFLTQDINMLLSGVFLDISWLSWFLLCFLKTPFVLQSTRLML